MACKFQIMKTMDSRLITSSGIMNRMGKSKKKLIWMMHVENLKMTEGLGMVAICILRVKCT